MIYNSENCFKITIPPNKTLPFSETFLCVQDHLIKENYDMVAYINTNVLMEYSHLKPTPLDDWTKNNIDYQKDQLSPQLQKYQFNHALLPTVNIEKFAIEKKRTLAELLFNKPASTIYYPWLCFGGGRHRTLLLKSLGVNYMPVQTKRSAIENCIEFFGLNSISQAHYLNSKNR